MISVKQILVAPDHWQVKEVTWAVVRAWKRFPVSVTNVLFCPCLQSSESQSEENRLSSASWTLILEWAQKLLGKRFADVQNLAEYLVSNHYVNGRSTAAFTVLAASQRLSAPAALGQMQGG